MKYSQLVVLSFILVIKSNAPQLIYSRISHLWLEGSYELGYVYPFTEKFSWN